MNARNLLRTAVAVTGSADTVTAVLRVRADEPVFAGHFPHFPVLPGVCVVESVHRAALATLPRPGLVLTAVDSARFLGPVRPDDELSVELGWSADGDTWCCRASAGTAAGRAATVRLRYRHEPPEPAPAAVARADSGTSLGLEEITALIPHRPPMLLLDEVVGLVAGERLTATRTARAGEPWGPALLVESWCQAAGVLTLHGAEPSPDRVLLLGSVQGVEFAGTVVPGDAVEHHVVLSRSDPGASVLTGQSSVDGRVVSRIRRVVVAVRLGADLGGTG